MLAVDEQASHADARIFAFKRPHGKKTVIVSIRTDAPRNDVIATGTKKACWKVSRYTPQGAGQNTMGIPVGT